MDSTRYLQRREQIEAYFDRTAVQAWERLTSNAPVGRIRATVREGRDRMRATLLSWLPTDMRGLRLLDAGCGTGALALEAMNRGASVVAIDLSPTLVDLARQRHGTQASNGSGGSILFASGDMLDPALGRFDHVVAMDSLIHYDLPEYVAAVQRLADRTAGSMLFTYAPRTPLLAAMHGLGRLFPRSDRSPALSPIAGQHLGERLHQTIGAAGWKGARTQRVACGFYTSSAWEWTR